jgi:Tfp pilus assembly protein PilF
VALSAGPISVEAQQQLTLSVEFYRQGNYAESLSAAKKAVKIAPRYAEAYNNMAAAYNAMGRLDDGMTGADEAFRISPDFRLARNYFACAAARKAK